MKKQTIWIAIGIAMFGVHIALTAEEIGIDDCTACGPIAEITDPAQKLSAVEQLSDAFRRATGSGQITDCRTLVQRSFGKGFAAVAGECSVMLDGRARTWLVCADDGVGNFAASIGVRSGALPQERLHDFVANCVGG